MDVAIEEANPLEVDSQVSALNEVIGRLGRFAIEVTRFHLLVCQKPTMRFASWHT